MFREMAGTPSKPSSDTGQGALPALPAPKPVAKSRPEPKKPWLWNVVLLDDQDHTYDYVIRMMQTLFGHSAEAALNVAKTVDDEGRAICATAHKELAELKRDQILAFGRDAQMAQCKGSMSAVIEPAEET